MDARSRRQVLAVMSIEDQYGAIVSTSARQHTCAISLRSLSMAPISIVLLPTNGDREELPACRERGRPALLVVSLPMSSAESTDHDQLIVIASHTYLIATS
jgi:hypothetical protein